MARSLRIERAGAWYHVTSRGNERRAIYRDDRDRQHFCQLLGESVAVFGWRLHAYVLMENHYHLLLETPEPNLGRGMQWLNLSYSVWFNRRHDRSGHLFQGRYKAVFVDPTGWALPLSRYIHLNPVRIARMGLDKSTREEDRMGITEKPDVAQIKARTAELRRYRWSSYQAYLGLAECPAWLRREEILEFGGKAAGKNVRQLYRAYVEGAIRQGLMESPWEKLTAQTILGGADFVQRIKQALKGGGREEMGRRELRERPKITEIIAVVEKVKEERWEDFRDRHGDWGRDLVLYLGRKQWGIKLSELGKAMGGMDYMGVSVAALRLGRRLEKDMALSVALNRCQKELQIRAGHTELD